MADKKISQLNRLTTPLLGDAFAIVNSGETKHTLIGDIATPIRNYNVPLTASGITVSGDIIPTTPEGATLGTAEKPFRELFLQSGSISIESDTPGDPSALISNNNGNLDISVGGLRLVQSGNSFIAETGSFQYISGSMTQVGDYIRIGNTTTTGSVNLSGSFEASLTENNVWVGDSNNRSVETPISSLSTYLTGSLVKSAYISLYHTSSQSLITSGSGQAVTFSNSWGQSGMSLVSGSRLVMENQGTYQFSFVAQISNSDNAVHDAYFWIKYNGSNFPNSTTRMTLPTRKDSGVASAQLMSINIVGQNVVDNGYIELWWTGDSTTLSLEETPAFGPVPETPSIIANIVRVG